MIKDNSCNTIAYQSKVQLLLDEYAGMAKTDDILLHLQWSSTQIIFLKAVLIL